MCPLATALVEFADQQETITDEITHQPRGHRWGRIFRRKLVHRLRGMIPDQLDYHLFQH